MTTFATPSELAVYLRTATLDEAEAGSPDVLDTLVAQQLLDTATGYIRDECFWHIAPVETVTSRVRLLGGNVLELPTMRLVGVSSLSIGGGPLLVDNRDYSWDESGRVEISSYPFGSWSRSIYATVTYSHGYAEPPAAVRGVCLEIAAMLYPNPSRHASESSAGVSTTFARPSTMDSRLNPYRRPVVV